MKTEMSGDGVINIQPESGVEAYALRQWSDKSFIRIDDHARAINHYLDPRNICIDARWPQEEK